MEVPLGNGIAYKVFPNKEKIHILYELLNFILPINLISPPFEPFDGYILVCFTQIIKYTCMQHNSILFCTRTKQNERVCYLIFKYTREFYKINCRFGENMFDGTVFDGQFFTDHASFYENPIKKEIKEIKEQNLEGKPYFVFPEDWKKDISKVKKIIIEQRKQKLQEEKELSQDDNRDGSKEEEFLIIKQKKEVNSVEELQKAFEKTTKSFDISKLTETKRNKYSFFYIKALIAFQGNKYWFEEKLSQQTHLQVSKMLRDISMYKYDPFIQPFIFENAIDTSFFNRMTLAEYQNPFYNDFHHYHHPNKKDTEFGHCFPVMRHDGADFWKNLSTYEKLFEIEKTETPFIYYLYEPRKDRSKQKNPKIAYVPTAECNRYIRVLFAKMKQPIKMYCKRLRVDMPVPKHKRKRKELSPLKSEDSSEEIEEISIPLYLTEWWVPFKYVRN